MCRTLKSPASSVPKHGVTSGESTTGLPGASGASLVLEIDEPTPSLNKYSGSHWRTRHRWRDRWRWLIRAALLNSRSKNYRPEGALRAHAATGGRVRVSITRYGARMLDEDNLHGGTKPLRDCLVAEGLLKDDRPQFAEFNVSQQVGKPYRTTVELTPI